MRPLAGKELRHCLPKQALLPPPLPRPLQQQQQQPPPGVASSSSQASPRSLARISRALQGAISAAHSLGPRQMAPQAGNANLLSQSNAFAVLVGHLWNATLDTAESKTRWLVSGVLLGHQNAWPTIDQGDCCIARWRQTAQRQAHPSIAAVPLRIILSLHNWRLRAVDHARSPGPTRSKLISIGLVQLV